MKDFVFLGDCFLSGGGEINEVTFVLVLTTLFPDLFGVKKGVSVIGPSGIFYILLSMTQSDCTIISLFLVITMSTKECSVA